MEERQYFLGATMESYLDFLEKQLEIGLVIVEFEGDEEVKTVDWVSNCINNNIKDVVILNDNEFQIAIHNGKVYRIIEF